MVEVTTLSKLSEISNANNKKKKRELDEEESDIDISSTDSEVEDTDSESGDDQEIVNIDFDFYNVNKDVDFHALKNLLRQLFGQTESNKIHLSSLVDLILDAPATTTIKCDGNESDPYCFLTLLDYKENKSSDYVSYLKNKVDTKITTFFNTLDKSNKTLALLLSERLINMPPEVVSPLFKITLEDAYNNLGNDKHYDLYFIVSRKYEVNFDNDEDAGNNIKKLSSNKRTKPAYEIDYFHPEDQFIEKYASVKYDSVPRKGIINSYNIIDHSNLVKAIEDFENEVSKW
ncbi:related to Protein BCP1 [Saccharomycodes ludwigii]|uniref:Protein BCP1 n=1 Tax=Saccharomycodes ludwigii TaxID=36035 RepID=A0A376B9Q8_9ASCO|nr:related to Protein BCP1 [Saccharomycodes ludwigii]